MVFIKNGGYRPVRYLSGQNGEWLRMILMCMTVRQRLARYGEGGDHDEDRRKNAVRGATVHATKLRSCRIGRQSCQG